MAPNEIIKSLLTSKSMLYNELFFCHNSERIKNINKNYQKTDDSTEILQGHDDKPSNDYDVIKWLKKKTIQLLQITNFLTL